MKFENTEVYGFKRALKGMRNPLESWHKNDTVEENGKVVQQYTKSAYVKEPGLITKVSLLSKHF